MAQQHVDISCRNRVLNAFSAEDFEIVQPHLEKVPLKFRQRLQSENRAIKHVYFPESGLASIVAIGGGERRQAEVAVVGHEGMTGLPIVLGVERSPCEVFVQVEGSAHCITTEAMRGLMDNSLSILKVFLRYAHVYAVQAGFTALANARGNIPERLARWLLMARDRLDSDRMLLTHDYLALMLGVRRAGVTGALQDFERRALIATARGTVTILNRRGLEECADGLYGAPEAEFERVFAKEPVRERPLLS
ncbi:MAG: Crp/Fnr family transcriptional regulator [Hyphomicrobiales bacterium]|nr:MAG: Crp/Fnr family transcriptional regulator [Hyphomicrobiales bacterium]